MKKTILMVAMIACIAGFSACNMNQSADDATENDTTMVMDHAGDDMTAHDEDTTMVVATDSVEAVEVVK